MSDPTRRRFVASALAAALVPATSAVIAAASPTRQITDMAGRTVTIPARVRRIYVAHDPPAIFLSSIAPDLMLGFTIDRPPAARPFLSPAVWRLPTIGGASRVDPEELLALNMDVAVVWNIRGTPDLFATQLTEMGTPVVMVDASPFSSYPNSFRFLGQLTGRTAHAERLACALEETADRLAAFVAGIPLGDKVRVYYADSTDGLMSDCATAFRGEDIRLAGGDNVIPCTVPDSMNASVTNNLETILRLDPEVVVARTAAEARFIRREAGWRALRAVRAGRVLSFPELPFNWAERPHSQLKILGLQWLANKLYPGRFPFDVVTAARDFFSLFYGVTLTDHDIALLHA